MALALALALALEVHCFLLVFFLAAGVSVAFEPLNHEGSCLLPPEGSLPLLSGWAPIVNLRSLPAVVALIGIKGALSDPNGVLKNWDEDSADPCSWTMITCSAENRVIVL